MTDIEKVIIALESLEQRLMYCGDGLDAWAVNEAVKALKAQEPRVMTLEEVSAVNGGDVIWIEDRCLDQMVVGIKFQSPSKNCYYIMLIGATRPQPFSKELYNVNWRCWTSRPDDERRQNTPWN